MGISTGSAWMGMKAFSYAANDNLLANDSFMKGVHDKLTVAGYVFCGFHGTSQAAAESLVSQGQARPSILGVEKARGGAHWDGFYVTNAVDYALGYCTEVDNLGKKQRNGIIRAYLHESKATHFFMSEQVIDANLKKKDFQRLVNHRHHVEKGEFLIAGPDCAGGEHHEMVISVELMAHLVFVPSQHRVQFSGGTAVTNGTVLESETAHVDIKMRRGF